MAYFPTLYYVYIRFDYIIQELFLRLHNNLSSIIIDGGMHKIWLNFPIEY